MGRLRGLVYNKFQFFLALFADFLGVTFPNFKKPIDIIRAVSGAAHGQIAVITLVTDHHFCSAEFYFALNISSKVVREVDFFASV
jgi:hypothetical protein